MENKFPFYDPEYADDHYFFNAACDYNACPKDNQQSIGFDKGAYSVGRHCLYRREVVDLTFEYTHKFFKTYEGKRKFAFFQILAGHSFFEKNHEFIDEHMINFFENMDKDGFLDNTIIQLYSDHGDHLHALWGFTPSGIVEKTHPMAFTIVPDHVADKYGENLKANQNKLMTHYELFYSAFKYTQQPLVENADY